VDALKQVADKHSDTHLKVVAINSERIMSSNGTVNIAEYCIISSFFQSPTKNPGIFHACKTNLAITFMSKIDEIEVLSDDRGCRSREIQRKRVLYRAEVVKLEYQLLGKVFFISPDNPSDADIAQAKLVATEMVVKTYQPDTYGDTYDVLIDTTRGIPKSQLNLG
jgi:hypothetical protein